MNLKYMFFLIFVMFCYVSLNSNEDQLNDLEFSGVSSFFNIAELLKQDIDPSKAQWDSFFSTPGYKVLSKEIPTQVFQDLITLSFKPNQEIKKKEILKKLKRLKNKFWLNFALGCFREFEFSYKNKEEIIKLIAEFSKFTFIKNAQQEAFKFLPEQELKLSPKISFVIFPDSRGYDPICIAINTKMNKNLINNDGTINEAELELFKRRNTLTLAHELFHFYRDNKLVLRMPDSENPDFNLVWILNQIENEGIADQIDKKQLYFENGYLSSNVSSEYRNEKIEQIEMIEELDILIAKSYNNPNERKDINKTIRNMIPKAGHPLGFFIANMIVERYGEESLIKVVRNPFAFIKLYNKVAIKNEELPSFSIDSIKYISELEQSYHIK